MRIFKYKILKNNDNINILNFLINRFKYLSLENWKDEILKGNLLINNLKINFDYLLKLNDEIQFIRTDFIEPEVDKNYKILFEDINLFIVNKPGNLPVHPSGRYKENTLLSILSNHYPSYNLFPVHRLDRETSGIQIFAKNKYTASLLQKEFERKKILKEYIVYIHGNFPEELILNGFLINDEVSQIRKKKKLVNSYNDKKNYVETKFILEENYINISKLLAYPLTGKFHQIRASLNSIGFPIVGDKLYGRDENRYLDLIEGRNFTEYGINRQALHSHKISLPAYKNLEINCEEPLDMISIFREAEKWDPSLPPIF